MSRLYGKMFLLAGAWAFLAFPGCSMPVSDTPLPPEDRALPVLGEKPRLAPVEGDITWLRVEGKDITWGMIKEKSPPQIKGLIHTLLRQNERLREQKPAGYQRQIQDNEATLREVIENGVRWKIRDILLENYAAENELQPEAGHVKSYLEMFLKRLGYHSSSEMIRETGRQAYEELKEQMRHKALYELVYQHRSLVKSPEVTHAEVRAHYQKHRERYITRPGIKWRRILLMFDFADRRPDLRKRFAKYQADVTFLVETLKKEPQRFEELAGKYGHGKEREQAGLMTKDDGDPWYEEVAPEYRAVLDQLNPGEVSEMFDPYRQVPKGPLPTYYSAWVKCEAKRGYSIRELDPELSQEIRQELEERQRESVLDQLINERIGKAKILYFGKEKMHLVPPELFFPKSAAPKAGEAQKGKTP